MDHFLFGQLEEPHGNQRADPAKDRHAEIEEQRHRLDGRGRGVCGLGGCVDIPDQRDADGGNGDAQRGDQLVNEIVGGGDDGRDGV